MNNSLENKKYEKLISEYINSIYEDCLSSVAKTPSKPSKPEKHRPSHVKSQLNLTGQRRTSKIQPSKNLTPQMEKSPKILRPLAMKSTKAQKRARKSRHKKIKSIHNVDELLSKKRTSTKKKIKLYESKIQSIKTKSQTNEVKELLQREWRRLRREGTRPTKPRNKAQEGRAQKPSENDWEAQSEFRAPV